MISIVICSKYKVLQETLLENIASTINVEYEIIHIDNSENKYSIFAAYNIGWKKSKYPYLCFVHEDVLFHTQNWGNNIITHLNDNNTGIIGLAGGELITRVPASWSVYKPSVNIIQSDTKGKKKSEQFYVPADFQGVKKTVVALDGVFIGVKRSLFEKISFDENFPGFHGYDFDISLQSTIAGYTNYVIYDLSLEHFSRGNRDARYYKNLINLFKKWENHLPVIDQNVKTDTTEIIQKIEKKGLSRLTRKLVRKGFTCKEITVEIKYFVNITRLKNKKIYILALQLEMFFSKLIYFPVYKIRR